MNARACFTRMLLPLVALQAACSKGEPPAPSTSPSVSPLPSPAEVPSSAEDAGAVGPMHVISREEIPSSIKVPGKLEGAVRWTDENGDNVAVFSRGESSSRKGNSTFESAYLSVQHVIVADPPKVLRSIKEKLEKCDADLLLAFRDGALAVTDLDKDGIGEITFAYAVACRTDMTPATLKLLMFEDGAKYILRGTMRGEEGSGGDFKVDRSFENGPPVFLEHAKASWLKVRAT